MAASPQSADLWMRGMGKAGVILSNSLISVVGPPAVDFYHSLDQCQETSVEVETISINEISRSWMVMSESLLRVRICPVNIPVECERGEMWGAGCGVPKRSVNGEASAVLGMSSVEYVSSMISIRYLSSEVYGYVRLLFRWPQNLSTYATGAIFDISVPIYMAVSP